MSTIQRIDPLDHATSVASTGAADGKIAVPTIFKTPSSRLAVTIGASTMLAGSCQRLSCVKWAATSGIDTSHATMPVAM